MILGIRDNILGFHQQILNDPNHRYLSWDHCYSYFQKRRSFTTRQDMDSASLHLAFYLASWGMYRGSSFLLWKDYKVHNPAVRVLLEGRYKKLWNIDFTSITPQSPEVNDLFDLVARLKLVYKEAVTTVNGLPSQRIASNTLITKLLLGTMACTPAYDELVIAGMKYINKFPARFGLSSYLGSIEFYQRKEKSFQAAQAAIATHGRKYPPMKLVDMYFWSIGNQLQPDK